MSNVKRVLFREITRPLKTTFSTSLGRKDVIRSIIVKVTLEDGSVGLGECPTSFTLREETVPVIKKIVGEARSMLAGKPIDGYGVMVDRCRKTYSRYPMTVSGLETALFRAWLAHENREERRYFGGRLHTVETDITIPCTTDMETLHRWLAYGISKGFSIFKVKVSGNPDIDRKLCFAVFHHLKDALGRFTVRLDGNQGFTAKSCLGFLAFLDSQSWVIELFEQPLRKDDFRGMREVKPRSPVPIILDETIFDTDDLERTIADDLCHGINIKIAKSGIAGSVALYNKAKSHGLKLMIGCMTETMAGLSAAINLAAGKGDFDYIDLDAVHFLHHRLSYGPIDINGPRYVIT